MKRLYLLFLFLLSVTWSFAQTYYVAVVRGQVYYQDKLLRKRDKIKMKGQLKFSSSEDYVKLSGPGGLYTIKPDYESTANNEFLVAVKEELFPKIRRHTTSANSMVVIMDSNYFQLRGARNTFFNKTPIWPPVPELKPGEELGFLHETDRGLFYRTASIKDSLLLIKKANFKLPKINGQKPVLGKTAIVKVMDKERWLQLVQDKDSIAELKHIIPHYNYFMKRDTQAPLIEQDPETGKTIITEPTNDDIAEILDEIGLPRFIKKRKMVKDLRFHLRKCKAPDIETFLDEYEYDMYIWQTYGNLYGSILDDVLRKDLRLPSQYDRESY